MSMRWVSLGQRWGVAVGAGAVVGLVAPSALADGGGFGSVGYIHAFIPSDYSGDGNGVELSYTYYPSSSLHDPAAFGGWTQFEYASPEHFRWALGGHVNYSVLGMELGYATMTAGGGNATTHGIHLGPFVSIGLASLGVRFTVPVSPWEGGWDAQTAIVFGYKIPFPVNGRHEFFNMNFGSGRPLRRKRRRLRGVRVASQSARVAQAWTQATREEQESVLAFADLWEELTAAGAPAALLTRVRRAALDEIRHAHDCAAITRRLSRRVAIRRTPSFRPGRAARVADPPFLAMAFASLRDGYLAEGAAAAAVERAAVACVLDGDRRVLARIAADEASHAELGWDIALWCLEQHAARSGERSVHDALAAFAGSGPFHVPRWSRAQVPGGHGFASAAEEMAVIDERWALCRLRLYAWLHARAPTPAKEHRV